MGGIRGHSPLIPIAIVLILGAIIGGQCVVKKKKDKSDQTVEATTASPSASTTSVAEATPPPTGAIEGVIQFSGEIPKQRRLKTGSDPSCRAAIYDETVLVDANRGLANAVIRIHSGAVEPAGDAVVRLAQTDCRYEPHVQAFHGEQAEITTRDNTLHNVHLRLGKRTLWSYAQPPNAKPLQGKLAEDGVYRFKCDVHPWMHAYVVRHENPSHATTDATGAYRIGHVPVGTHDVTIWHEKLESQTTNVTVTENETTTLDITLQ